MIFKGFFSLKFLDKTLIERHIKKTMIFKMKHQRFVFSIKLKKLFTI